MIGETVGSYQITGLLSTGGMGSVYTATHTLIGRPAAVKMLLPEFSQNREIVKRFFDEAKATAAIRHPGIVEIFDFGYHASGQAFLVMELLQGEPLSAKLAREKILSEDLSIILMRSIMGALAAAHARGIVHRDLKPDNVFLVRDPDVQGGERPKLLDFGIAKLADNQGTSNATRTGVVMGTPTYMSPEQCRGAGLVDGRSDLYAIGCIFYEMVAGRPPFQSDGAGELIAFHMMKTPDPPRAYNPNISEALEEIILRLLEKDPAARFASANELLIALGGTPDEGGPRATAQGAVMPTPVGTGLRNQLKSGVKSTGLTGSKNGVGAAPTTLSAASGSSSGGGKKVGLIAGGLLLVVGAAVTVVVVSSGGDKGGAVVMPATTGAPMTNAATGTTPTTPATKPVTDPGAGSGAGSGSGAATAASGKPDVAAKPDVVDPGAGAGSGSGSNGAVAADGKPADGKPADGKPADGKPADGTTTAATTHKPVGGAHRPGSRPPGGTKPGDKPKDPTTALPALPTEL